jgi:hypothetical protein
MTALLAAGSPEAAAIGAPGQPPLSFQGLRMPFVRGGRTDLQLHLNV